MRLNKCLTVEEVINSLLDQALDKRRLAGEDKYSIFMDDAIVLENAALMLDANHEEEPARLLTEADFVKKSRCGRLWKPAVFRGMARTKQHGGCAWKMVTCYAL